MRYFIIFIGILISVVLFTQAQGLFGRTASLAADNKTMLSNINDLQKSLNVLNLLKVRQPQSLLDSYQTSLNNIRSIALANNATLSVKSGDLQTKKDGSLNIKDSGFSGVSQVDYDADVFNLTSSQQLASVLDGFSNLEKSTPIIIKQVYYEKDYVVFKLSVLGV